MNISAVLFGGSGGILLMINGVEDHVHILAKLTPDEAVSDVFRDLKSNASGWMHNVFPDAKKFSWQNGYGAFSVGPTEIGWIKRYIANQKIHHPNSGSKMNLSSC